MVEGGGGEGEEEGGCTSDGGGEEGIDGREGDCLSVSSSAVVSFNPGDVWSPSLASLDVVETGSSAMTIQRYHFSMI